MTTLYRPVLIETAEQAEALPAGAIVPVEDKDGPWEKRPDGAFQGAGRVLVEADRVLDRIALVPVEVRELEERVRGYLVDWIDDDRALVVDYSERGRQHTRTTWRTPWEPA